ncbi:metallophosphoesterase family protein [Maledivibacter halophilus]|uniref:Phosphoesterase n=1 Tax=Maledivibacter halophilus TaxID=36842 RepID=A0A1T5MX84_9FIRM|nr:metallophosphoesterase [Maledivibacter halophilus]SKC92478.1 hypothetical protein SAMN02194393_05489 [Maledivibacter halophilus]
MRIGILSDTHGDLLSAQRALKAMGNIDLLLHAGDTYRDAKLLEEMIDIDVIAVKGNIDFHCEAPSETIITIEGKKIFLTHGHNYNVKFNLNRLYYKALEINSNIVIFGHSHMSMHKKENGIDFINPGSISRPRGGTKQSYAIMNVCRENVDIQLFNL